tara:strand:+ start:116 stop:775 length:660 start_codon:yes stop_codon:yes gene_type:complete
MSDYSLGAFISALRACSKCQQYPKLIKEWDYVNMRDGPGGMCICGHDIRYEFFIKNKHTGAQLIVGSQCIKQFPEGPLKTDLHEARKAADRAARKKRADAKKAKAALDAHASTFNSDFDKAFAEGRAECIAIPEWAKHFEVYQEYIQMFRVYEDRVDVMYYTPGYLADMYLPLSIYGDSTMVNPPSPPGHESVPVEPPPSCPQDSSASSGDDHQEHSSS